MNETNFNILNSLPLVEVMRGWGHVPRHETGKGSKAWYKCPWHDPDNRPSFSVDKQVREGAVDLGFKCWAGRDGHEGFGAVQLAAQLMGLPVGKVPDEELGRVLNELATRCDVELQPEEDDQKPWRDRLRKSVTGWDKFREAEPQYADMTDGEVRFEPGEWTEEGLRALGFKVELAARRATKKDTTPAGETAGTMTKDNGKQGTTEIIATAGRRNGATPAAEVRIGDTITDFDPDSGEPLYRCSLGRDFYRGPKKAETRTIKAWGEEVERVFGVQPVSRFLHREKKKDTGQVIVLAIRATKNYPIFIFQYPWGWKKYEPKDSYGKYKWTWWNEAEDGDLYHQWYADAALEAALTPGGVYEQDERHPYVEVTLKDKDGNELKGKDGQPVKVRRFERVVLCSGPRDAMAVYSHSDAHVMWLHSEQAGFDHKGGNVRPNRWLRALLKKVQQVTVDGGLYVCYDEDAVGLAASQAIALNSPNIHWLRLPKELSEVVSSFKFQVPSTNGASQPETLNLKPETKAPETWNLKPETKHLKDVTDFVLRFADVEARMPADLQHDDPVEWFDNALFDTPTCQFWQWESVRKDADGTGRARYKFDLRNTPIFLRAKGLVRRYVDQGDDSFSRFFLMGNDHTFCELFPGQKGSNKLVSQARDLMADWLRAHKEHNDEKGALSRAIYSAKLEQGIMESIEVMDFDAKSYGEDFDFFFFKNTAVRVTKDKVEPVPYSSMRWWTNSDAILDGHFTVLQQPWHVTLNPFYEPERVKHEEIMQTAKTSEERAQENMRWDQWASLWRYRLVMDRPIEQMPMHFRFLYNTCRIFWEKEQTQELTSTDRQMQDMYFIAMLHAIGSALVRHRSANRQQFLHITDNGTRREDLASGGTGKTAILELLSLVRPALTIDGKALEGSNIILEQELGKIVPGLHNLVCLDELPQGFSPKKMYNMPLGVTSRGLYHGSVRLTGDDLPKFVVASNEHLDLSSDSTSRRVYQVLVGDWYHPRSMDGSRPAHTPADDFRREYGVKEVARNLPAALLNEARNLLLGCVQLFLTFPDETIMPPKDSRALLRQALAASKDEQFTRWIASYLMDKRHLGQPIAQRELAISLLDYCGITVGEKTIKAAYKRIRDNLDDYIRTSIYVCNPRIVILTDSDAQTGYRHCAAWQYPKAPDGYSIATDDKGNRLPRELVKKAPYPQVYYFYRKSKVPKHRYDPAHLGDPDYVQPAPETDPEAEGVKSEE